MSAFALKLYQQEALDKLREYLQLAVEKNDVDVAFYEVSSPRRAYRPVEQLPLPPYVCLRVPTGGGKTLMACHSISIVAQEFLRQERCVVLWLVPTNTIKDQTLKALRDRAHPYRQALDATLEGGVRVVDVDEAQYLQKSVFDSETVILVTTLANPRIGDTDKRKMYDQNGSLMNHFDGLLAELLAKLEPYEGTDKPIPSLANVLCLRRPVVVMDEAHNARTDLSFDTLARFDPSCILEFTATPATNPPSNVLCRVSAAQLKSEDMIKLPILLETNADWRQTILAAVNRRDSLEELAQAERKTGAGYIRPIVLLQAEKRNEDLTVDVLYKCLREEMGIPEARIAIETGEQQDLKDVDLFLESCEVRYIITVDKLREGWDCSFAYVLCSVRNMGSKTAVEQILGRVLRMPYAKSNSKPEMNQAYAYVTSMQTADTMHTLDLLKDALENSGFTPQEAAQMVETQLPHTEGDFGGMFARTLSHDVPAEKGELFVVPQLALWTDGELVPVEETHFLEKEWLLSDKDTALSEAEYPSQGLTGQQFEIDVDREGGIRTRFIRDLQRQLDITVPCDIATPEKLALWLDKRIPHPDIVQVQSSLFLLHLVERLMKERGVSLDQLARDRMRLRDAAEAKIQQYRAEAAQSVFEDLIKGIRRKDVQVSPERVFTYPRNYPVNSEYVGSYEFRKHYYRAIGEMNHEEEQCAQILDALPNVKYWVRNLAGRRDESFWLQTTTDRFYPDFMALLEDGRVAAVEYKGAHISTGEDTDEKTKLGKLWEESSDGRCLFLMVTREDYAAQLRGMAA